MCHLNNDKMATTCISCTPGLKKLVKLLKGIDQHYPDSVTAQLRKEYREAIRSYYGDDFLLEVVQAAIEAGEVYVRDLTELGDTTKLNHELRALHYLNKIHEELDRKWREINMVVGHCGTPCNLGCPECAPGGYDHAGEV